MHTRLIPTYPLRPVNGGPFPKAPPKSLPNRWTYEPKVNGWRVLVHCPSGDMFNRKLEPLSIQREFRPVLEKLKSLTSFQWLDCEAFERRHPLGRGSLVILDTPDLSGTAYCDRQQAIYDQLIANGPAQSWLHEQFPPETDSLLSFAYSYSERDADPTMQPRMAWDRLQRVNKALKCPLFEGLVAKRVDSHYPLQLRSPDTEFPFWVKHRWSF